MSCKEASIPSNFNTIAMSENQHPGSGEFHHNSETYVHEPYRLNHPDDIKKHFSSKTYRERLLDGTIYSDDGSLDRSGITLLQHLDTELEKKYPGKYTNFYKLYFIADAYPDPLNPSLVTQGFSNFGTTHGVFFNYHDRSTISHETFHAIGLAHTFDGISSSAKFTYKAQQTDNIMDYSHWSQDINGHPRTPVEGKVLYLWQWLIVNPLIKLKG